MYVAIVTLLMFVLPIGSVVVERVVFGSRLGILDLLGQWSVFWSVGVRLFTAGIRQVVQPSFTARDILGISDERAFMLVQEIGFSNIAVGVLGICSRFRPAWILPAAVVGGLFYGLAGVKHLLNREKNALERVATFSDIYIALVLLVYSSINGPR